MEHVPWHEGGLVGKSAAQVTPRPFSVRKACSWTTPLGVYFEIFLDILGFVFVCFFKRHPEQHYVDFCSICDPFLDNCFEVFGAGSL